jgi:hypothetical protein
MFVLLIVLAVVAAVYALRGVLRAAGSFVHRQHSDDGQHPLAGADAPK